MGIFVFSALFFLSLIFPVADLRRETCINWVYGSRRSVFCVCCFSFTRSEDLPSRCSLCHIPYRASSLPFPVNLSKCAVCKYVYYSARAFYSLSLHPSFLTPPPPPPPPPPPTTTKKQQTNPRTTRKSNQTPFFFIQF